MNSLSFNDMNFNPVNQNDDQIWITSSELARMLGYSRLDKVTQIFNRKADEFTSKMTRVIENPSNVNLTLRIFSLRGAHLIAVFARTPVAKEFRKWVLDVLDKESLQQQIDTRVKINAEQQVELKEIVDRRAQGERRLHAEMWSRHNKHFRITRYSDLLAIHFQDAVNYLETLDVKSKGSIYIDEKQSLETLCVHARFFQAWWNTHSPALAKLNPLLVTMLNDNMFSMSNAISDVSKKCGFTMPNYDYDHMFELKTLPHERYRLLK
ncbi:Bro-N domain-containing protein [Acinetobacter sp. SwsAc6]|uniref:BRO-N domain-containing protein n=1 Tax=Acinetobacter sp. SwsAc6 TaxID=2749439 RepID=UPI0015C0A6F0|nr:Bro-N domain-containing protein [Acinetobacter sp. SwsAc6]NWK75623.1 Bro-N domain-containing protein [Acinetobacter sp. SwsAc6]